MLHRFHDRFGTAGVVLGVIALILALGGSAYAAGGLTSQQEKQVKKIAKKFAGKPGTNGTNGTNGAAGAKGDTGGTGLAGTSVTNTVAPPEPAHCEAGGSKFTVGAGSPTYACNGEEGEAGVCSVTTPVCALPSGATLTGLWSFAIPAGGAESAGAEGFTTVSFPLQVTEPEFIWIGREEWLGIGEVYDTTSCPGSYEEPEAAPGKLCFYARQVINSGIGNVREPESSGALVTDTESGVTKAFAIIDPTENARAYGSWAVTAP